MIEKYKVRNFKNACDVYDFVWRSGRTVYASDPKDIDKGLSKLWRKSLENKTLSMVFYDHGWLWKPSLNEWVYFSKYDL